MNKRSKMIIASVLVVSLLAVGIYVVASALPSQQIQAVNSAFDNFLEEVEYRLAQTPFAAAPILGEALLDGRTFVNFDVQVDDAFLPINATGEIALYASSGTNEFAILGSGSEVNMQEDFDFSLFLNPDSLAVGLDGSGFISAMAGFSSNIYGINFATIEQDIAPFIGTNWVLRNQQDARELIDGVNFFASIFEEDESVEEIFAANKAIILEFLENAELEPVDLGDGLERLSFVFTNESIVELLREIEIETLFPGPISFYLGLYLDFYIQDSRLNAIVLSPSDESGEIRVDLGSSVYDDWTISFIDNVFPQGNLYFTWSFDQSGGYTVNTLSYQDRWSNDRLTLRSNPDTGNAAIDFNGSEVFAFNFNIVEGESFSLSFGIDFFEVNASIEIGAQIGTSIPAFPANTVNISDWDFENLGIVQEAFLEMLMEIGWSFSR